MELFDVKEGMMFGAEKTGARYVVTGFVGGFIPVMKLVKRNGSLAQEPVCMIHDDKKSAQRFGRWIHLGNNYQAKPKCSR